MNSTTAICLAKGRFGREESLMNLMCMDLVCQKLEAPAHTYVSVLWKTDHNVTNTETNFQ